LVIGGVVPLSFQDFPGRPAIVVFTRGCNMRCPWCHNPGLVDPARYVPPVPAEEVLGLLARRRRLVDAVVVSGGEPTLHTDLGGFLQEVRQLGYAVKLDTNGTFPEVVEELLAAGLVDAVAVDFKLPLQRYGELGWAGEPDRVARSLRAALALPGGVVRTTVVPGIHTTEVLREMEVQLRQLGFRGGAKWVLQAFRAGNCLDDRWNAAAC
jgi:pyruvate formate lyase activating enzyme